MNGFTGQIPTFIIAPFGSILAGSLAKIIGVSNTILIGGISCVLGALIFAHKLPELNKMIHSIYVRLNLMPQEIVSEI